MDILISLVVWVVIFAAVAFAMLWVRTKFLGEFPPARWICGAFLLIALLYWLSKMIGGGGVPLLFRP